MIALLLLLLYADPPARHPAVVRQFEKQTGYPKGRPGFVVDHIVPLCAGGVDDVTNMQWQAQAASYRKDIFERALCAAIIKQGYKPLQKAN